MKDERGFTFVELLTAIAVIGVMAAVVLVSLSSVRVKARDGQRISGIGEIQKALELYYDGNQSYPSTTPTGYTGLDAALVMLYQADYLKSDPSNRGFRYIGTNEAYPPYTECTSGECKSYILAVRLEQEDNPVLQTDVDAVVTSASIINFNGRSTNCGVTLSGEYCFDGTSHQVQK